MKTKCTRCGYPKPRTEFARDWSKKSGFKSQCKSCCSNIEIKAHKAMDNFLQRYHA